MSSTTLSSRRSEAAGSRRIRRPHFFPEHAIAAGQRIKHDLSALREWKGDVLSLIATVNQLLDRNRIPDGWVITPLTFGMVRSYRECRAMEMVSALHCSWDHLVRAITIRWLADCGWARSEIANHLAGLSSLAIFDLFLDDTKVGARDLATQNTEQQ